MRNTFWIWAFLVVLAAGPLTLAQDTAPSYPMAAPASPASYDVVAADPGGESAPGDWTFAEPMPPSRRSGLEIVLLPLWLMAMFLAPALLCYFLASAKGYPGVLWGLLALIPVGGWFLATYMVGAPDRKLRAELAELRQLVCPQTPVQSM